MNRTTHESRTPAAAVGSSTAAARLRLTSAVHVSVLAAGWVLLTDTEMSSWVIGLPAVVAAAWTLRRTAGDGTASKSLLGIVQFVPYFLWQSVRGGLDVALRTLAPRMRIRPGYVTLPTRLTQSRSRIFLTYCVNLLPGTLTADLHDDQLHVHLLDTGADPNADLRRLEYHVARVFRDEVQVLDADRM